eukprot:scaffold2171_cov52-Phaeocystis_antarctica.AAC.4
MDRQAGRLVADRQTCRCQKGELQLHMWVAEEPEVKCERPRCSMSASRGAALRQSSVARRAKPGDRQLAVGI